MLKLSAQAVSSSCIIHLVPRWRRCCRSRRLRALTDARRIADVRLSVQNAAEFSAAPDVPGNAVERLRVARYLVAVAGVSFLPRTKVFLQMVVGGDRHPQYRGYKAPYRAINAALCLMPFRWSAPETRRLWVCVLSTVRLQSRGYENDSFPRRFRPN